jgi:uncharacterized membrane protein
MNKLQKAAILATGLGLLDALYLLLIKLTEEPAFCIQGIGDCWTVNSSKYSEILGVPISLLGAATYLAILLILTLENRYKILAKYGTILLFGITLSGTIYSVYLTYLEIRVIHAICLFCIISALLMLLLLIFSIIRLRKDLD